MIAHVLDTDRVFVLSHPEHTLTEHQHHEIERYCTLRANGYPLAYIIGSKEFYGRSFAVTPDTLIPRPETEIMITEIMRTCADLPTDHRTLVIDIGTGSGAIITTLVCELSHTATHAFIATDISCDALNIARSNMHTHNVGHMITTYESDLLSDTVLQQQVIAHNPTHVIIAANLPYVDDTIKDALLSKPESCSLQFEPDIALWSTDKGLAHYKALITQTCALKNILPHTQFLSYYEIDPAQQTHLTQHIASCTNTMPQTINDLAQKPRTISWII